MKDKHLTPEDLSDRWKVPLATLSQWRWNGKGPHYLKLGRHIVYLLQDVELFEEQKRRRDTTCSIYAVQTR